jgi:tetratricopeptide (TPR) repeat protein/DNA-binding CsgD family transcriptional regulator
MGYTYSRGLACPILKKEKSMSLSVWRKIVTILLFAQVCYTGYANDNLYQQARGAQRSGEYDEAIVAYKSILSQPVNASELDDEQLFIYTEALVQLMNTFQSKGEPEACILLLEETFDASPLLQNECLRDFYSVKGYALSRTERMSEAEEVMMMALTMPLYRATPERYFRDYAYAAAVFYSNPNYQTEVINWCQEALRQALLCKNTSGAQWVKAMLGSLYKKNGHLNNALELFQQAKEEAAMKGDDLGVINSLHALVDLFLYWDIPEYANLYATEAVCVELRMSAENPMVSAQTYINKGRVLYQLGVVDSISYYTDRARKLCQSLPYNSGMVDVDLLHGSLMCEVGGDSINIGIRELALVAKHGTAANRAKAYHQLARTYLKQEDAKRANVMLDSLYTLLSASDLPLNIALDYEPILNHYLKRKNYARVEDYVRLMLQEQQALKAKKLNFNLVESIVDLKVEQKRQQQSIMQLKETNQRLWFLICIAISVVIILVVVVLLFYQKRRYTIQMRRADERFASLVQELNQSNVEKEKIALEIKEFLKDNDNRKELETLTPFILKEDGETKFRQCFEMLYPLFLHRLRDRVPSITRREELLSMLIVLKQDNKEIAELLAIAPRSVLMLRHRFRQKIGMTTEYPLENFIDDILGSNNAATAANTANPASSVTAASSEPFATEPNADASTSDSQ